MTLHSVTTGALLLLSTEILFATHVSLPCLSIINSIFFRINLFRFVARADRRNGKSYPYGQHVTRRFRTFDGPKDTLLTRMTLGKKKEEGERLLKYIKNHQAKLNFDITRQRAFQIVRENLGDYFHTIHPHRLRHFRFTHLVSYYHFDPFDVTSFCRVNLQHRFWWDGSGIFSA